MEQSESVSDFGPKKLPRQLDFTPLCGASANSVFPEHLRLRPPSQPPPQPLWQTHHAQPPQSHLPLQPPPWKQLESRKQQAMPPQLQPPALERIPHPVHKLPLLPMQFPKQDSPGSRPKGIVEAKDGTPKKPKQCNCKSSQCLKLYCECFAAGSYCNGCNCANCYNNVENEAARQEAVGAILERNPNAFRPKIAGSANGSQDEDSMEAQLIGKHNKGCYCKKSSCLNTVSASRPIFCALRIVNAWTARTLKEVKKENLSFTVIVIAWPTYNRQLMLPLVELWDFLAMTALQHQRSVNVTNC